MATYTTRNRLVKQATNENLNTWGAVLNTGAFDMIDDALDGITALAISGANVVLTDEDGATDQARRRILNITSSDQARTITVPAVEKFYIVRNASSYTITLTVSGGGSTEVLAGQSADVFTNGTSIYRTSVNGWGLFSTTAATSGTNVLVTINPNQHFTSMKIIFAGVSSNGIDTLRCALKTDANTSIGNNIPVPSGAMANGSNVMSGVLIIDDYRAVYGTGELHSIDLAAPSSNRSNILSSFFFEYSGGPAGRVDWSWVGGATFDASGSFKVYLK